MVPIGARRRGLEGQNCLRTLVELAGEEDLQCFLKD